MLRLLQIKPSPDWKGREAVAERQWRELGPPEPWKAGKNTLLGIFSRKFSSENLPVLFAKK